MSFSAQPTSGSGVPYPGDNITMEIHADPGSLCAVGVVDRSVHVMEEPSYLSVEKVSQRSKVKGQTALTEANLK